MRIAIYLFLLTINTSLAAKTVDQSVEITAKLAGQLTLPAANPSRIVLMLHGWNGSLNEIGDLYKDLAVKLAEQDIASLRFNFSGEGERVNYVVTSTLDSRLSESTQAYQYLRNRFPEAIIGVQGFSLGGLTAMLLATTNPDWFRTMVLWSAADAVPNFDSSIASSKAAQRAMREGRGIYTSWADITLTREHLASFVGVNASLNLAAYKGPVLSIRGDQDYLPANERKWFSLLPTADKALYLIGGADHIFNVLENPRPDYSVRVHEETVDWFVRTLSD